MHASTMPAAYSAQRTQHTHRGGLPKRDGLLHGECFPAIGFEPATFGTVFPSQCEKAVPTTPHLCLTNLCLTCCRGGSSSF